MSILKRKAFIAGPGLNSEQRRHPLTGQFVAVPDDVQQKKTGGLPASGQIVDAPEPDEIPATDIVIGQRQSPDFTIPSGSNPSPSNKWASDSGKMQ